MVSFGSNPAAAGTGSARNAPGTSNKAATRRARNIIGECRDQHGRITARLNKERQRRNLRRRMRRSRPEGPVKPSKPALFAGCRSRIACYTAAPRLPALVRRSEPQETVMTDFKYSLTNLKPVESTKIALTFPDGASREFPKNTTGLDIAKGISPSLAKRTVAMALDGTVVDLADPIEHDARIEFIAREDPRALELIRHDAAHVMAEAVQSLWPGTQVTIGPVIDNGFFYDFCRNAPFTPEDLPV